MSMTCCVGEQCTAVGFLTTPEEKSSGWMMTTIFVIMVILLYELAKFVITAAAKRMWPGEAKRNISRHTQCEVEEGEVWSSTWRRVWVSGHGEKFRISPDRKSVV